MSNANAETNRKMPVTTSWKPNTTAMTTRVLSGQTRVAIPAATVTRPNASAQPQCLPTWPSMSAGSAADLIAIPVPCLWDGVSGTIWRSFWRARRLKIKKPEAAGE